ncbi:MAG TPA: chromate efflux transporter [Gemmatimonadaceae bacterium]|nr:chromate efflux transporter [Gemmatimonadaceae bacterium]
MMPAAPAAEPAEPAPPTSLGELARVFLQLGLTSFGGPAAHIARMEEEIVRRRGWLTHAELLDLIGASQLIPGPNSTELAIHIGLRRRGWPGLVVAGACFIVPAALLVGALAWAYVRWGTRPGAAALFRGVKPVIIAIVARALWGLGRTALRTPRQAVIALAALAVAPRMHELLLLLLAGAASTLPTLRPRGRRAGALALPALSALPALTAAVAAPFSLGALFLLFVKIGAVLYGSGYVLLAFLRADLVERRGWLTEGQLLDAVAAGQVTPGPVFTTATFVGYLLGGAAGATVATLGIFLPAFVFVALSGALIPRIRAHPSAAAFLDGVNAASLALMAWVTLELARAALVDVPTVLIAAASLAILSLARVSSVWLLLAGAAIGMWMR